MWGTCATIILTKYLKKLKRFERGVVWSCGLINLKRCDISTHFTEGNGLLYMRREKIYINEERFKKEITIHHGERHPAERVNGRRARLWVQSDLAAILHITKQHLTNVKRGKDAISEGALNKLAEVWHVTPEWLRGLSNQRTPEEEHKNRLLLRFEEGMDKLDAEYKYLYRLGFSVDLTPDNEKVELGYYQDDDAELQKVVLSYSQFKVIRNAMNKAASVAVMSCLEMLNEQADSEEKKSYSDEDMDILVDYALSIDLPEATEYLKNIKKSE